jgi:hypothetical protein
MNLKVEPHSSESTPAEEWLTLFENHSRSVAGSSEATVRRYRSVLWHFLSERFGRKTYFSSCNSAHVCHAFIAVGRRPHHHRIVARA